ncbi:hypothetical protein BC830DRAFT_1172368 [Chytriomyces sp. MP71]|nr:hypothetical protein BC830DRAFT_1172570 [Chytriomyces sp. MP71]KAI8610864.1 hypothetical protein BC830DRAFT_1172368 [Chytriomyces sp. MP71]
MPEPVIKLSPTPTKSASPSTRVTTSATTKSTTSTSTNPAAAAPKNVTNPHAHYCVDNALTFCVVITKNSSASTLSFTAYTYYTGWIGFGAGNQMKGSRLFVSWYNSTNGTIVSERVATGHVQPVVNNGTAFTVQKAPQSMGVSVPSAARLSMTVTVPSSSVFGTTGSFVWAVSGTAPFQSDLSASGFQMHDEKGVFSALVLASGPA